MKQKIKKIVTIALATTMLLGATLTVSAHTHSGGYAVAWANCGHQVYKCTCGATYLPCGH